MKLLLAVVDDLYSFAVGSLFRGNSNQGSTREGYYDDRESVGVFEPFEIGDTETEVSTFRLASDIMGSKTEEPISGEKNTVMYIGGSETPMYLRPTREFDSVIARLPYGAMVMVLEQNGRWTRTVHNELSGWVLREDLVDRAAHVYPKFVLGEKNTAEDPNTIRVRAMLEDAFAGGMTELGLQAPEYVVYRLFRKGLAIQWPEVYPRTPGLWHKILKGSVGTHVGISPKTGSVMEYMHTEEIGHLAYVEAVFPDETINISEVNYPDSGIYNERVLTREEWRELRPLFIQVT